MDAEGYRNDLHYTEAESPWHVMQKSGDLDQRSRDGESWKLVDVFLSGGAPWGFTLRGGLEHREPLLITKVEEGSKAAAVCLQVGDELVNINEIPLSGYRQEAICLVKGSHKTLRLVVKRRNEPISRPHSWHATKFNESQSETAKTQSPPTPVWHTRYDASSSSTDLSSGWEQTNLRRVSDQFSSLGSMDSLEHVAHPYPAGQLSPAKSNNSMEHLGGGKRDSAYSSFSTSSGTPDYTLSKSNTASTENMLYKVNQWDAGGKHNNGRNSQNLTEGGKQDDRLTYFQMPGVSAGYECPQIEDPAGSRHSTSSRTSFGPVWNVPEKKKTASPSPPPPPPPARSDSFAATKVHERGLGIAHPEGPDPHKTATENRRSHNLSLKIDSDSFYPSSDKSSHNQFSSNKQYSLSSSDVRQGQPYHQRHHSDKSTLYSQPWATSVPKPQNAGGYHCSMQEMPTNGSAQHFGQNQRRNLSTSLSITATDQNTDSSGHSRYYCVTTCQPTQPNPQLMSGKPEDRRSVTGVDLAESSSERNSLSPQTVTKVKYHQPQQHSSHSKDSNGYSKHQVTTVLETCVPKPSSDNRGSQRGHNTETPYVNYPPTRQSEHRRSLPLQHREIPQDIRYHSQVSNKISPQVTPMLHSLSMDAAGQDEKTRGTISEESIESKQAKRTDRFATTLRNEIQMRRAKLQKSRSAAILPGAEGETEDDQDVWKSTESTTPSSADGSFTNTYKDHLKEAQARVLKATSFRRKDLEPVLVENPAAEALPNYPSSALARKDVTPLPTVTESVMSKSGPAAGQVTRIGGRKRFSAEKKVRSFSEPDKIHEVGVKEDLPCNEKTSSSLDRQKLFKESGNQVNQVNQGQDLASIGAAGDTMKGISSREYTEEAQRASYSAHKQSILDQQRLGTFAEYEARWNTQKKPPETRASGRYRSADNILDPGPEERTKTTCLHERSRSSPSADIYGQKIPVPARKSETEFSQTERKPAELLNTATGFSDRSPGDCKVREKPVEFEHYSAPPPPPMTGANPDSRHRAAPATVNHRPTSVSHGLTESGLPQPGDHSHNELPSGLRRKPSALEKPPPPTCPEVDSQESLTSSQSEVFTHCSPNTDPNSAFVPTHSAKGDSEQGKGLVDKGQGAVHHLSTSNPQLASSPPASSYRPSGLASMERQRSPSPQFSPQRLSDKPPVSLQDEDSSRMEHVTENQNSAVKKVPIKIVHLEGATEKENSPFLKHSDSSAIKAEAPGVNRLSSLGGAGQDSVFCVFTRQREPDSPPASQTDTYMTTVRDHINSNCQQPPQPTDEPEPSRDRTAVTTGLTEEDQKREELARDIMGKDKSLADILDQSKMKTTMDLMEGIFPQGEQLLEEAHQRRKVPPKQSAARPAEEREKEDNMAAAVTMVTSSTYYSTSAPKAELLIKMKDMQEQKEEDSEEELDINLANKKQELIDSLSKKLQVLREARESLQEDILDNNALGDEVEARVQQVCKPNELDKFRMFVGDLDKVVSLLLSLSGRLARVENALNSLEEDATAEERRTLVEKRKLLIRQHEDAKELKENLDRRERVVYDILANYLQEDSLTDYEHFVKMKSALIIEQRKLEDKIKLGDEQLKCLMDSLPIEQRLSF
ncbi:protein Shroom2 isoform X2 [Seriola lalandi dorsalis]|uniref:Shroom family member 2 n=1 Tax=Seriola lalandi dorsalis TaxID=1841481 RepID=A0A3B4XIZ2_SERLL|nr:protein Shroom2 isoform X2 [Seriola lalandi dorsalis]XP_056235382.1 protein Shroom2 isoform X4 [Seriola aureovittata]